MRSLLLAAVLAMAVIGALGLSVSEEVAYAKGTAIGFTPDAGPAHEEVMVSGGSWPENTEVRLFAAFSPTMEGSYPHADEFVGPFEVVRSDIEGRWEALITPDTVAGLDLPGEPGYLIVRAESDDLPLYLEGANSNHFVLTVDGQRPVGSGEIEVSLFMAEGEYADLALWGWRRAGGSQFTTPYGLVPVPFEPTIASLRDGEYEIVAVTNGGHEPIGPNTVDVSGARLCLNPACGDAPIVQVHSAFRVTVEDAQVVEANVVLGTLRSNGSPTRQEPKVDPLVATVPPSEDGRTALIAGASVLLAILAAGTAVLRHRRASG